MAASLLDLPRDPDFAAKAARVLDLYQATFDGAKLGEGEYVVSADEKTSIQARCRCHPSCRRAGCRSCGSSTSTQEDDRGGALAYLGAWDVHRARRFGRCEPTTRIARSAGCWSRS